MTIFFTSDQHYGHANVIKYCNRPYQNTSDMTEDLVAKYNAIVNHDDSVYFLGDFSFCNPEPIFKRLQGRKYCILGNHDQKRLPQLRRLQFEWIKEVYDLVLGTQHIWLSHFPHLSWPYSSHGGWHLHGHTHGTLRGREVNGSIDVGVDCWDMTPVALKTIQELLTPKTEQPVQSGPEM